MKMGSKVHAAVDRQEKRLPRAITEANAQHRAPLELQRGCARWAWRSLKGPGAR